MDRRDLIRNSIISGATLAAAGVLFDQNTATAAGTKAHGPLTDALEKCISTGYTCLAHCQSELAKGNTEMAKCQTEVMDMLASCRALQELALRNSEHTKTMAQACSSICKDCAAACDVHAKHMAACKECMEACLNCEKACKAA
ncbi:MAG: Csp1 family four helix bundle copper storage protein [Oligoflexales bacterium]